jgi:hypothetical protein
MTTFRQLDNKDALLIASHSPIEYGEYKVEPCEFGVTCLRAIIVAQKMHVPVFTQCPPAVLARGAEATLRQQINVEAVQAISTDIDKLQALIGGH